MISFIIPFAANDGKLDYWGTTDVATIVQNTVSSIKNINKIFSEDKEIILVDNTHNFPAIDLPYLKVVKGLQGCDTNDTDLSAAAIKYNFTNFNNQTIWASMAFNIGLEHAKGDYVVLQHNDIVYHNNVFSKLQELLDTRCEYITVDNKKVSLSAYVSQKDVFNNLLGDVEFSISDGGYVKTTKIGLADAYFFFAKKEFFDDYKVDWLYGDTNHGATIKCLQENKKFLHIGPFYDNPNFTTAGEDRTYIFRGTKFLTHLKGGFSEGKMSHNINPVDRSAELNYNSYLEILNNNI